MKCIKRGAVSILMTMLIICAALGSRGMSVIVRAQELNNEQGEVISEEPKAEEPKTEEPKVEGPKTEELKVEETKAEETVVQETKPEEPEEETSSDVCFFIRRNGIGADIPEEPGNYATVEYSSAIRVNGAISSDFSGNTGAVDGSEEDLLSDEFTASNDVSKRLLSLPQAEDIKNVIPEFDETKQYVVWYVIKSATTADPNADVMIHVDGVIRERTSEKPADPEEPQEPKKPEEVSDPIPNVTLEIRALFLEDGKEAREVEYDGKEHIVGGFEIVVKDKESNNPIIGYLYECYGKFIGTKSYADEGLGTEFTYQGQTFWVNVVKAFAKVTNIGDSQEVVFYDANNNILSKADDFIIKDSAGNILPAKFNVVPVTGRVSVRARDITFEAGTTVKNDQGETLTNDSYTITSGSLLEGHRIENVVINGSQTGVGKSVNEITSINIVDENGNPVNNLYNIKKVNGKLILVDPGTGENKTASGSASASDSKVTSIVSVKKTDSGLTATTGNVVMNSLQAAGNNNASQRVLGARRADTSDPNDGFKEIFLMCMAFSLLTISGLNCKKNK